MWSGILSVSFGIIMFGFCTLPLIFLMAVIHTPTHTHTHIHTYPEALQRTINGTYTRSSGLTLIMRVNEDNETCKARYLYPLSRRITNVIKFEPLAHGSSSNAVAIKVYYMTPINLPFNRARETTPRLSSSRVIYRVTLR